METKRGSKYSLIKGIPYQVVGKTVFLDRDAMEKQAYRYRVKNLKLQRIRIALSSISILLGVAIFIYWVTRG